MLLQEHASTAFLAVVVAALGGWWLLTRRHDYWRRLNVPGPRPLPFFGTHLRQFFVPMQQVEEERYAKFGKVYGVYDGGRPGLIVGDPELIEVVMKGTVAQTIFADRRAVKTTHAIMANFLSSLEGPAWKRVRRLVAPTFSTGALRSLVPCMRSCADSLLATLAACEASPTREVDLKELFGAYTMDVIARTAFATKPTPDFARQASALFTFPFWRKFLDYTVPMAVLDTLRFTVLPKEPMDFFRAKTLQLIRHRRATGERQDDFLQLLLDQDEELELGGRGGLSEDEILAQSVLFFSVGFETSSQLLMYCCYLLALHPEHQEAVYEELLRETGGDGNQLGHELGRERLPYLNAVIDETLRLYNPVLRMERRASEDFELRPGLTVPAGMLIGIPVWALHHCHEYFPNPHAFDPTRFLAENRASIQASTYLPFGQGPRDCIGRRFSLLETRLALAEVLLHYAFEPSQGTQQPLRFVPNGRPLLGPTQVRVAVARRPPPTN